MTPRTLFILGATFALLGVAAGAFGAHGLRKLLPPEGLIIFETGARYQMYHAFALIAAAWLMRETGSIWAAWAGIIIVVGIIIFSGSLYALSISGIRILGAITPIGGVAMMVGWVMLIVAAAKWRP